MGMWENNKKTMKQSQCTYEKMGEKMLLTNNCLGMIYIHRYKSIRRKNSEEVSKEKTSLFTIWLIKN